jgi:hypothetical protein
MTDETQSGEHKSPTATKEFKYEIGDLINIPAHNGKFVAKVVKRYPSLEDAVDQYEASFRTILSSPFGKAKEDQNFYYCEVDNSTHKHVGVAEEHATLKRAAAK